MTPRPRPLHSLLGLLALAAAVPGCDVPVVTAPDAPDAVESDSADADVTDAGPASAISCHPSTEAEDCPEGWTCLAGASVCVECLYDQSRCADVDTLEVCDKPEILGVGVIEGGTFVPQACGSLQACSESTTVAETATCEDVICTDGATWCVDPITGGVCAAHGTRMIDVPCDASSACYSGTCEVIRHNVLLLFDTSSSMHAYLDGPGRVTACETQGTECYEAFPTCDDPEDPLTLFTLAKAAFHDTIEASVGKWVNFALQRFPQRVSIASTGALASCTSGYYSALEFVEGDDHSHETFDGGWFDVARWQAIPVPFPPRNSFSNSSTLLSWLDFDEGIVDTGDVCTSGHDCPLGTGCRDDDGDGERHCFVHQQPELRANGITYIGKSLFYAGEYYRRHVLIDGKPCASDAECESAGYLCRSDGVCADPYRECREHHIILFSDGQENSQNGEPVIEDEFFWPEVQAKRFAFGLGCETDDDCRGGGVCEPTNGICHDAEGHSVVTAYKDPQGFDALTRPDGSAARIRTSVLHVRTGASTAGEGLNKHIAEAGDGAYFDLSTDDPDEIRAALENLMLPSLKCEPEDFLALGAEADLTADGP